MARADRYDTFNVTAGLGVQHDSNLFRLSDGVDPAPLTGKSARSDRISTVILGVDFAKAWSLQQFEAGLTHVGNRYATYGFLDNDANNGRAAWRWQVSPRVSGGLTYDRTQALVGFADYLNYGTKNMRTVTVGGFNADWWVMGGWHLRAGGDRTTVRNGQIFAQDEGSRTTSADLGVRYLFPSASWIEVATRTGNGNYYRPLDTPRQLDDGFRERRHELRGHWATSGKSTLDGSLGRLTRRHDHFAGRDYGGSVGSLRWTWAPTAKLALELGWKRDLAAYITTASSYYLQDAISIAPSWQVAAKVKLGVRFESNRREYRGPIVELPFAARQDRLTSARLAADWTPLPTVVVSGFLAGDRRSSNASLYDYKANMGGATMNVQF